MGLSKVKIVCDATCHIPNAHLPSRPSKGKSACGYLILDAETEEILEEGGKYLGECTPPEAEWNALILAMDKACAHCRIEAEVWTDSDLVVKQMNGDWRLKKDTMKEFYDQAKIKEARFRGRVNYFHHPRTSKWAKKADELAKGHYRKCMDE